MRHLAELGVVFLLFNIGLELSLERLRSMQKYVFGMGTAQVRYILSFRSQGSKRFGKVESLRAAAQHADSGNMVQHWQ